MVDRRVVFRKDIVVKERVLDRKLNQEGLREDR